MHTLLTSPAESPDAEVSDTRDDDSSTAVGNIKRETANGKREIGSRFNVRG